MGKHEAPPFRMVLERGKLVPATAFDAERLDTYRTGATMNVRFVEEKNRWGIRKWWAVVNRAVKECPTPWKTTAEASEAIKLALGIVNLTKTVGGAWMQYPKSLTELTDPELEEAVEQMLAVMYRVTGIDPDDWRKQIADIGKDEHDPGSAPLEPEGSASGHDVPTSNDGASSPAEMPVEAGAEGQEQSEPAPASEDFTADEWKWLREMARPLWRISLTREADRIQSMAKTFVPPADIRQPAKDKARAITKLCIEVADGEDVATRRRLVAAHMGISEVELREVEP